MDAKKLFTITWVIAIAISLLLSSCAPQFFIRAPKVYNETLYITEPTTIDGAIFRTDGDAVIIRADNVKIINSTFEDIGGNGIVISSMASTRNVLIEKNRILGTGGSGIISKEKDGFTHTNTVIRNNYLENCGGGNIKNHCIYAYTDNVQIIGNEIHNSSGNGIAIRTSGLVSNNRIFDSSKACIRYFTDRPSEGILTIEQNYCDGVGLGFPEISILDANLGYDPVAVVARNNVGDIDIQLNNTVKPGQLLSAIANARDGDTLFIEDIHDLNGAKVNINKTLRFVGIVAEINDGTAFSLYEAATFQGITFRSWRKPYGAGVLVFMGSLDGVTVDTCTFIDVPAAIYARNGGTIRNISVLNSIFENINSKYKVTVIVIDDGSISDITIKDNTFINLHGPGSVIGILIGDNGVFAQDVDIESNTIRDIQAGLQGRGMLIYADHVRVLDNHVSNINKSSDQPRTCIYLKSDDGLIDGNVLHNCGSQAGGDLTVKKDVGYNVISNNVITGNQPNGYGIFAKTNALVTGNQISRPGIGMQLYSGSDDEWVQFTVINNIVTSDIAVTIWGRVTGTGCGNDLTGKVNSKIPGLEEPCGGLPPATNTPQAPTHTPVVPPTASKTPVPPTYTATPSRVPTSTLTATLPACELVETELHVIRICEK